MHIFGFGLIVAIALFFFFTSIQAISYGEWLLKSEYQRIRNLDNSHCYTKMDLYITVPLMTDGTLRRVSSLKQALL